MTRKSENLPKTFLISWIGARGNAIVLLLASSALFAQSGDPPKIQDHASTPDVREIVESSIAATQRHWQARLRYTYMQRYESRRLDLTGRVKFQDVDISKTVLVNGVPCEQLVERNGQPPSIEEERKDREKLDEVKRETPRQRTERLREQAEQNTALVREVPKAFDFQLVGDETIDGRPAYVLQVTPRPGYHAEGKYGHLFSKVSGKLWVDKQDLGWIKADAQVIEPFSTGLFLARVLPGSHITIEQTRVDDGIWMPEHIVLRAAAKILFVKNVVVERILTYSEYRLPQAEVPATGTPASP